MVPPVTASPRSLISRVDQSETVLGVMSYSLARGNTPPPGRLVLFLPRAGFAMRVMQGVIHLPDMNYADILDYCAFDFEFQINLAIARGKTIYIKDSEHRKNYTFVGILVKLSTTTIRTTTPYYYYLMLLLLSLILTTTITNSSDNSHYY